MNRLEVIVERGDAALSGYVDADCLAHILDGFDQEADRIVAKFGLADVNALVIGLLTDAFAMAEAQEAAEYVSSDQLVWLLCRLPDDTERSTEATLRRVIALHGGAMIEARFISGGRFSLHIFEPFDGGEWTVH